MSKMQIKRVYQRPEIEIMYVCIYSPILEASYPGDHQKGEKKTRSCGRIKQWCQAFLLLQKWRRECTNDMGRLKRQS